MTIISLKAYSDVYIKTFYGYVERPTARKGVGSTDGQSAGNPEPQQAWTPKSKEAERFLGEPGEIIETLIYGREIVIKWKDTEYSIERNDNLYNAYSVCEANKPETEIYFNSFCELLDFKLKSNDRLKEIITKAEVVWRNI